MMNQRNRMKKYSHSHWGNRIIYLFAALIFGWVLVSPAAAQTLSLKKISFEGSSFLEDEAGIAAYMNAGQVIDLSLAKKAFRTIEEQTDSYIIGSDSLPGYPKTEDVHAYVSKEGWIVVYYLRKEPTSKIIDFNDYYQFGKIRRTKLDVAIMQIVNEAFIPMTQINYYHFGYPNANKIMIVVDKISEGANEDNFEIKLPNEFTFGEISFLHFSTSIQRCDWGCWGLTTKMYIDGQTISEQKTEKKIWIYGILTPTQISKNIFHNIKIDVSAVLSKDETILGAMVLVYQKP